MNFKDLFSQQAPDYYNFRPTYPRKMYNWLAKQCARRDCAWDVGTGNGQAAVALSDHFKEVIATDPSESQLAQAEKYKGVRYVTATAENSGIESYSVDLIAVAQSFHWFKQQQFFTEVERVARKPGAVLAVWCYGLSCIDEKIDVVTKHFYNETTGPYWEPERQLVDEGYAHVKFPFEELKSLKFEMTAHWDLRRYLGYLGTWSALRTALRKTGTNLLSTAEKDFAQAWGDPHVKKKVTWPLAMRIFRV